MQTIDMKTAARLCGYSPTLDRDFDQFERQRLNDLIVDGTYDFAPPTTPGKARQFDIIDVAGLRAFAFFLGCYPSRLVSAKFAAKYAREVVGYLRSVATKTGGKLEFPEQLGRMDFPVNGFNDNFAPVSTDEKPQFYVQWGGYTLGSEIATLCINLDGLMGQARFVMQKAEEEQKAKAK